MVISLSSGVVPGLRMSRGVAPGVDADSIGPSIKNTAAERGEYTSAQTDKRGDVRVDSASLVQSVALVLGRFVRPRKRRAEPRGAAAKRHDAWGDATRGRPVRA